MQSNKNERLVTKKLVLRKDFQDIAPVSCGIEECSPSQAWTAIAHDWYILHFVVSGNGKFKTDRGSFYLGENEVFVIKPGEIAYYEADKFTPWNYIWICFHAKTELPETIKKCDVFTAPYLKKSFFDSAERPDSLENVLGYEEFLLAKIWEIISLIKMNEGPSSLKGDYVKHALNIIETEFQTGITASDIAARLYLNRAYFTKIFTEATKQSPGFYLHGHRMQTAANLLRSKSLSVAAVASSVGFTDVSSFSRAFKSFFGIAPGKYAEENFKNSDEKTDYNQKI